MDLKKFKIYIGKPIAVAIPHNYDTSRFFYHFGKLISVDDDTLTVETKTGLVFIPKEQVKQITIEKE
jgi:ribosome maturation factor RimP